MRIDYLTKDNIITLFNESIVFITFFWNMSFWDAIRLTAQERLLAFATILNPKYSVQNHHRIIADHLHAIEKRDIRKLLINMPPRSGKTHLVNELFPSWYLWRHPDHHIISSTYSADLSHAISWKAREFFKSDEFKKIFPWVNIAWDSASVKHWKTDDKDPGWYISVGVWWSTTGKWWNVLLTDDPIKDAEQANSQLIRDKIWEWYNFVMRTRFSDDKSAEIVVQTRWHEDDLAWRLKKEWDWVELTIPAIDDKWESYWPDKFSKNYLLDLKGRIWPYAWNSLYMQEPVAAWNGMFKKEYFNYYEIPQIDVVNAKRFTFVDPAISLKQSADYTAIVTIAVIWFDIYILDIRHWQWEPDTIIDQLFDVVNEWDSEVGIETVQYQKMLAIEIRKQMDYRGIHFVLQEISPMWEKTARISSMLQSRYASNRIHHLPWVCSRLESELLSFPRWKNDDISDALSWAINMSNNSGWNVVVW